ncbi:MAG: type II toxin-antitoxin system HicA family toxin [Nanoarchaeota archaeon]|nr:type II toxin-antitoxin system HicA family toxin [Nanoarchaeota archaeon]MBU1103035.1 type II toxin-antitoxin system HicA family toxin [Nanoarchaeota archaeon]
MARLPQLTAVELIKVLEKIGFKSLRQEGSHIFLRHEDGRTTVVPSHPGRKLDRWLLLKILKKDVQVSREDFEKLL